MKIYSATITNGQMAEINEAEYSAEWEGDVRAYLFNALDDENEVTEGIPGDIQQNFGGLDHITNIHTVWIDGIPHEVWFAAE